MSTVAVMLDPLTAEDRLYLTGFPWESFSLCRTELLVTHQNTSAGLSTYNLVFVQYVTRGN